MPGFEMSQCQQILATVISFLTSLFSLKSKHVVQYFMTAGQPRSEIALFGVYNSIVWLKMLPKAKFKKR